MEDKSLFNKINEASNNAQVTPSNAVWNRLEKRLDQKIATIAPAGKGVSYFSIRHLSLAASIIVLIGAYTLLNNLGTAETSSTSIRLEGLHTLEVNPIYNVPVAGESSTIPSVRLVRSLNTSYKIIEEGTSEQKIVHKNLRKEVGLG